MANNRSVLLYFLRWLKYSIDSKKAYCYTIIVIIASISSHNSVAQLSVSKIFSDNMVLQREIEVPIWGWAKKGEKINISFDGKYYDTRSDKTGKWRVVLPEMDSGGPYDLVVKGSQGEISFSNIYVGDVWLCSGQSNMEWPVELSNNASEEVANASDQMIRHFKVPRSYSEVPEVELEGGEWQTTNPENVGQFTAVGYYFAKAIRDHVDVPIGLLNSSWGGSRIEPWMHAEILGLENPQLAVSEILEKAKKEKADRKKNFEEKFGPMSVTDIGMKDEDPLWAADDLDDSDWIIMDLPGIWEERGFEGLDGVGWYRRTITLTSEQLDEEIMIGLGMIDDSDIVWINGKRIGGMEMSWNIARKYSVDPSMLKEGENLITIRVEDTGGGGGIHGEKDLMFIQTSQGSESLAGEWKFRIGAFYEEGSIAYNQVPTLLFNKMINPILDFPIKGALWYQGESNAFAPGDPEKYSELFPTMITDWRKRWGLGDFPFLWVQLANFMEPDEEPSDHGWATLRESQTATLNIPNTAQAVIIDIGEADDIHPRNKQDVGYRLSLAARKLAYGEDLVYSGPVYKSHRVEDNKIIVSFTHIGNGLKAKDKYGYVRGFAISGEDGKYVWAKARIEGEEVVVWNEAITSPTHIRYAWGINPHDANLYNEEGLPANPFRTDE